MIPLFKFWVHLPSCLLSPFSLQPSPPPHYQSRGKGAPGLSIAWPWSLSGVGDVEGGTFLPIPPCFLWVCHSPSSPYPPLPGFCPFPTAWPATYSCTGPHWWSRQSQCLCFLDSGCRSSDGSQAGRSPWHNGCSDGCWCCSSALGSTGLQASREMQESRELAGRHSGAMFIT